MKNIIAFFCWLTVLILWGCAASIYIHPGHWWSYLGIIGLGFPICVAGVLLMALVCLFTYQRLIIIPIIGLVGCYGSLRDYCPVNLSGPAPKGSIKVLSYNICSFNNWETDENGELTSVKFVCSQNADLICLQEATFRHEKDQESTLKTMEKHGYHYKWLSMGGNSWGFASKYPIVKQDTLCQSGANGATVFYTVPEDGDTIIVINAHLESMHLSSTDRNQYHQLVKNIEHADTIKGKRTILYKLSNSTKDRSFQADTVATFIDEHKGKRIILMGDFNDTPVSYSHHKICERLTDAYRSSGNGIGRSFNKDAIYVRIDNIFCSEHFKPFGAKILKSVLYSDHYPITAYLKPVTP